MRNNSPLLLLARLAAVVCLALISGRSLAAASPVEVLLERCDSDAGWMANLGLEAPGARGGISTVTEDGQRCLRVDFDFSGGGNYVCAERACDITTASELVFSIKAVGGRRGMVRLRDASGQEHLGGFQVTGDDWQRVRIPLTPQAFRTHWGGKNDGAFHFPVVRMLIGMNRAGKGHLLLKDVAISTTDEDLYWRVQPGTPFPGNIAFVGEGAVPVRLMVRNNTDREVPTEVRLRVSNYEDRLLMEKRQRITFGKWEQRDLEYPLPAPGLGYYRVDAEVTAGGKVVARADGGIGVVMRPPNMDRDDDTAFFGLHVSHPESAARIGVKWDRTFRFWRFIEGRKGTFNWHEGVLSRTRANHIQVMMVFESEPPGWAKALVPPGEPVWSAHAPALDAYRTFVREMARHYGKHVAVFEVQNEPDLSCWRHNNLSFEQGVEHYVRLAQAAIPILREEASGKPIAAVDVSGVDYDKDLEYSRAVMKQISPLFDIYTGHPYASPRYFGPGMKPRFPHENHMVEKLNRSQEMLAENGGKHRLWIGEKGWGLDVREPFLSPYSKAYTACIAQALISARSVPGVERFFWFLQQGCNEKGYEYGLWRGSPAQPLPAAVAYATAARFLEHARPQRALNLSSELRGFSFQQEGQKRGVVALWSLGDDFKLSARWPKGTRAYDMIGREISPSALVITESPLYLTVPPESLAALCTAIERQPAAAAQPVRVASVHIAAVDRLVARLTNREKAPVPVSLRFRGAKEDAMLPPAEAPAEVSLAVKGGLLSLNGQTHPAAVLVRGKPLTTRPLRVDLRACPRRPLSVDAPLESWGKPMLAITERAQVLPPDPNIGWNGPEDLSAEAWWAYDNDSFHLVTRVRDDMHSAKDAGAGGFWKSDSIQVAFDMANDATEAGELDGNDVEFGAVLSEKGPRVFVTHPRSATSDMPCRIRREGEFTIYQLSIPWKLLGVTPRPGAVFSFNFIVNDNDGHGRAYWMGPRPGIGEGKRPAEYLDLYLE